MAIVKLVTATSSKFFRRKIMLAIEKQPKLSEKERNRRPDIWGIERVFVITCRVSNLEQT